MGPVVDEPFPLCTWYHIVEIHHPRARSRKRRRGQSSMIPCGWCFQLPGLPGPSKRKGRERGDQGAGPQPAVDGEKSEPAPGPEEGCCLCTHSPRGPGTLRRAPIMTMQTHYLIALHVFAPHRTDIGSDKELRRCASWGQIFAFGPRLEGRGPMTAPFLWLFVSNLIRCPKSAVTVVTSF